MRSLSALYSLKQLTLVQLVGLEESAQQSGTRLKVLFLAASAALMAALPDCCFEWRRVPNAENGTIAKSQTHHVTAAGLSVA